MVFKKSLTPLSKKGRVDVRRGKGSTVQRTAPRERESVTGGTPLDRMTNRYPAAPQPLPNVAGAGPLPAGSPPAPGGTIGPQPTAAMPGGGLPEEPV